MTIPIGEVFEQAIWATGEEPPEMAAQFERDLRAGLAEIAAKFGVVIGTLLMTEMRPGEERVPEVPAHIHGPDVRLLVGEATVVDHVAEAHEGAFVADLEPKDLERLRTILRRVHAAWNPGKPELSTERCDEYINQNGPDAALRGAARAGRHAGALTALVVFTDPEGARFQWLLRPGFRHVFVCFKGAAYWTMFDWRAGQPDVHTVQDADYDLTDYFADVGYAVVETEQGPPLRTPLVVNNCVGMTKMVLGIRAPLVQTPFQLYRFLVGRSQ